MPIPFRCKNPPESLPVGTVALILANVVIFALTLDGFQISKDVLMQWGVSLAHPDPIHMLTAMFLHGSIMHIAGNMWFLYLFGFAVEGRLRTLKFLTLYLLAGFAGDGLQLLFQSMSGRDVPGIGASGAIMGVMGAAMYMFPHAQVSILWRFRTFDMPMWGVGLYYIAFDMFFGFLYQGHDGVAHFAHLGGVAGGILVALAMRAKRDNETVSQAKATLHEAKDLSVLSPFELKHLAEVNPTDTTITLNWLHRGLRDSRGPSPESIAAFQKHLPQMLHEQPIGPVAAGMAALAATPGVIPPHLLMDAAMRLEKIPDAALATRLYGLVLADPSVSEQDAEAALFRTGLMYENHFLRKDEAAAFYQRLVVRFPMGPFADQARMRLRAMKATVPA